MTCDVLSDDDPKPRLVPLPKLLPSNRSARKECRFSFEREYRDVVACTDGTIRCVEAERCLKIVELPAGRLHRRRAARRQPAAAGQVRSHVTVLLQIHRLEDHHVDQDRR